MASFRKIIGFCKVSFCTLPKPNSTTYLKKRFDKNTQEKPVEILKNIFKNFNIKCKDDLKILRNEALNSKQYFNERNVDRILLNHFLSTKNYNTGLNYIEYLDSESKLKLNIFLTNYKFRFYFFKRFEQKSLSEKEEVFLLNLYNDYRKEYPVLNASSLESAILALSITKEWKKSLELLSEIEKTDTPSDISYSVVMAAAFLNDEEEIAFKILNQIFKKEKHLHDVVFSAFMEHLENLNDIKKISSKLDRFVRECGDKDIFLSENTILEFSNLLKNFGFQTSFSSINKRGFCSGCQKKLEMLEISDEIFNNLKQKIISEVIVGKNIFSKTTPEEFSKFQKFLAEINNYDVVIDGLNVAYAAGVKQSLLVYSTFLAHVVTYFVSRNKKIVVLGRDHMKKWPKKNWNYIQNNAKVFLTQDLSQDDPYFLYSALHCAKNTVIVSRDLMRSHLFLLKDPEDKMLFSKWLTQRQYQLHFISNDGAVHFKFPLQFDNKMQKNGNVWHIPYKSEKINLDKKIDDYIDWLCIKC